MLEILNNMAIKRVSGPNMIRISLLTAARQGQVGIYEIECRESAEGPNLCLLPGTQATATFNSYPDDYPTARIIDGLNSNWVVHCAYFLTKEDGSSYIDIIFPTTVNIKHVRYQAEGTWFPGIIEFRTSSDGVVFQLHEHSAPTGWVANGTNEYLLLD